MKTDTDQLGARLLAAGRRDKPSERAQAGTLAALGVSAAAATLAEAAARRSWWWATAAKVAGASGLVLAIGVGVWLGSRTQPGGTAPALPAAAPLSRTPEPEPLPSAKELSPLPAPQPDFAPGIAAAASSPLPTRPRIAQRPAASAQSEDRLGAEVQALDHVRRALRGGTPSQALKLLDDFDAGFPRPVLAAEARLLRIEALAQSGDREGARRMAEEYVRLWPDSPLADRARVLGGVGKK
jgi:hypothetical protein